MTAVKAELGLLLGRNAARSLKTTLGLAGDGTGRMETVGVDAARRTPRVEQVPGWLVAQALEHIVTAIVDCVEEMLSDIPPNLAEDVVRGKIRLAGGGALLPGLADRIEAATAIPVVVVDDPLRCVARGAAEILEHGDGLQQGPVGAEASGGPEVASTDHTGARADRAERVAGPPGRAPSTV